MASNTTGGVMFAAGHGNVPTIRAALVVPCDVIALSTQHVVYVVAAEDTGTASRTIRYIPVECRHMLNPPLPIEITKRKTTLIGLVERAGYGSETEAIGRLEEIIARKIAGGDCTEDESAEIKHYIRHHPEGDPLTERLADAYPAEANEAYDELDRYGADLGLGLVERARS